MRPKSILIHTRKWFDKTYGNTYFTGLVEVGTGNYYALEFQYGDQDIARDKAAKLLQEKGYDITYKDLLHTGTDFDHYEVSYFTTKKEALKLLEGVYR